MSERKSEEKTKYKIQKGNEEKFKFSIYHLADLAISSSLCGL
jgi:hypothetical protein